MPNAQACAHCLACGKSACASSLAPSISCGQLLIQLTAKILQVWLQEWAWTESGKAQDVDRRDAGDTSAATDLGRLHKEPMFCFESCIKLLYWTALVYDHRLDEVRYLHYNQCSHLIVH